LGIKEINVMIVNRNMSKKIYEKKLQLVYKSFKENFT